MKLYFNFVTMFSISRKKLFALFAKYMHIFWVLYFQLYEKQI